MQCRFCPYSSLDDTFVPDPGLAPADQPPGAVPGPGLASQSRVTHGA